MDDFRWNEFPSISSYPAGKLRGSKYIYPFLRSNDHFFHKDWYQGEIFTADGERHEGLPLRYDAYNDQLVVYNERVNALFVVDRYMVDSFLVKIPGDEIQIFRRYPSGDADRNLFLQVLYQGKTGLLCRNYVIEEQTRWYKDKAGRISQSVFVMKKSFYLSRDNRILQPISPSRKQVIGIFPDRKLEIRRYLRKSHLCPISDESLPGIIELLDRENFF